MNKAGARQSNFVTSYSVDTNIAQEYRAIKGKKSETEKDTLIEQLLRDAAVGEALRAYETIPNMQRASVSQWAETQQPMSPLDLTIQRFNASIKKTNPAFIGFSKQEISLILAIKALEEDNIHIYADTDGRELVCWIVCQHKEYALLDRISELIIEHEYDHRTNVEWIFMSEQQYVNSCAPAFAFYF